MKFLKATIFIGLGLFIISAYSVHSDQFDSVEQRQQAMSEYNRTIPYIF